MEIGLIIIVLYIAFSIIAFFDACIQRRIIKTRERRGDKPSVWEHIHSVLLCGIAIYCARSLDKSHLIASAVILVMWGFYRVFVRIYVEKGGHLNFFMIPGWIILFFVDGDIIDYSSSVSMKDSEKKF